MYAFYPNKNVNCTRGAVLLSGRNSFPLPSAYKIHARGEFSTREFDFEKNDFF